MPDAVETIRAQLLALQDTNYRAFQCRLMPTVDPARVIGVRTPALRKLAKTLRGTPEGTAFLAALPHHYYEEDNLHGLLLSEEKDYAAAVAGLERFLPFVDNWATCDLISPRAFARRPPELPGQLKAWMASGETYTVRFGLGGLLRWYLDEAFRPEYLTWAGDVCCEEYYVNMMVAWYFATALAKQPEATLPWLEERRLPRWVHNKTIQKVIESFRVPPETKEHLRALRWRA